MHTSSKLISYLPKLICFHDVVLDVITDFANHKELANCKSVNFFQLIMKKILNNNPYIWVRDLTNMTKLRIGITWIFM